MPKACRKFAVSRFSGRRIGLPGAQPGHLSKMQNGIIDRQGFLQMRNFSLLDLNCTRWFVLK
jgi:hypothetical protein